MIETTGHLPECYGFVYQRTCICDQLRDCEARVREDERNAAIEAVWRVMEHSLSCYTTGQHCLRCDVSGEIEALGGER